MPVPSSITDLSTTPGTNSPAGSENPATFDDYMRTYAAFIAQLRDGTMALTGDQTIAGIKTFSSSPVVPDASFALSKLQTVATSRILGRATAGTGVVEELTVAQLATLLVDYLEKPGFIKAFAGSSAPTGWLALPLVPNTLSRAGYPGLFAAIGTTWGAGDGSTTFGCPYMPANYVPVQASGNVGSASTGDVKAHVHNIAPVGGGLSVQTGPSATAVESIGGGVSSGSTGGAANLAAGMRFLWCVKL